MPSIFGPPVEFTGFVDGSETYPPVHGSDENTGVYFANGEVNVTTNGNTRLQVKDTGLLIDPGSKLASAPALSFVGATDCGFYLTSTDTLGIAHDSTKILDISINDVTSSKTLILPEGSPTAPPVSYLGDANTGFFHPDADTIGTAIGGANLMTFNSSGILVSDSSARDVIRVGTNSSILFNEDSDNNFSRFNLLNNANATSTQRFFSFVYNGTNNGFRVDNNASVTPVSNNNCVLGNSTRRWNEFFCTNPAINTSDGSLKENFAPALGLAFIKDLNPVQYKFKDGKRQHMGLVAQDLKKSIEKFQDFGGYIEDVEEDGTPFYGIRYGEFISPLIKATHELDEKIESLSKRIKVLEEA